MKLNPDHPSWVEYRWWLVAYEDGFEEVDYMTGGEVAGRLNGPFQNATVYALYKAGEPVQVEEVVVDGS